MKKLMLTLLLLLVLIPSLLGLAFITFIGLLTVGDSTVTGAEKFVITDVVIFVLIDILILYSIFIVSKKLINK